jgi:alkylation response protein AidB-like acyl-CoA dehydrogenase
LKVNPVERYLEKVFHLEIPLGIKNGRGSFLNLINLFSPYYNDSHRKWRAAVRAFVDKEVAPFAHEWDENKKVPREMWVKLGKAGLLPSTT